MPGSPCVRGKIIYIFERIAAASVKAQYVAGECLILLIDRNVQSGTVIPCRYGFGHKVKAPVLSVENQLAESHIGSIIHYLSRYVICHVVSQKGLVQIRPVEHPPMVTVHSHYLLRIVFSLRRYQLDVVAFFIKMP